MVCVTVSKVAANSPWHPEACKLGQKILDNARPPLSLLLCLRLVDVQVERHGMVSCSHGGQDHRFGSLNDRIFFVTVLEARSVKLVSLG